MAADKTASKKHSEEIDLESFVPALLTFISNRVTNSASATYRRRFDIGVLDFRVMVMLSIEPGASGARIAEVIDLDKAAVSRTLNSLHRRGLITAAPGHGRARILALTAAGEAVYGRVRQVAMERERRLLADLSVEDREILRELLRRVLAATPRLTELAKEPAPLKTRRRAPRGRGSRQVGRDPGRA